MQGATTSTTTPLRRFAFHTTTTCSSTASAYGKCVLAAYTDMSKDACKDEYAKFVACLYKAMKRKW